MRTRLFDESELMTRRLSKRDESIDALFTAGCTAWENGQYLRARDLFLKAAAVGDAGSANNLGVMYCGSPPRWKDYRKAMVWFKRALKLDPHGGNYSNVASTYDDMGNRRLAALWWKRAQLPRDGDNAVGYAKFLLRGKRVDRRKVARLLRKAVKCRPWYEISEGAKEEAEALLKLHG
jgi:TPR repeat protein